MTGLVGAFSLAALSMLSTSPRIFSTTGSKMDFISSLGKRRLVSYNLTPCVPNRGCGTLHTVLPSNLQRPSDEAFVDSVPGITGKTDQLVIRAEACNSMLYENVVLVLICPKVPLGIVKREHESAAPTRIAPVQKVGLGAKPLSEEI